MNIANTKQPRQRLPYVKKTRQWRIDNIDSADNFSFYNNERVRKSLKNKIINLNLYNGHVDIRDMTNIVNPNGLDASFIPENIPHHPIVVPKIDLLVGEEAKRRFDWTFAVVNPDAISKKEEDKKQYLVQRLREIYEANYQEEELEQKLTELEKYMKYSWQDLREKMANQIMKYYWKEQNFEFKFNQGFKDALLMAEEIYLIDIIHNEPTLEKLNPLKVYPIRSGNSDRIEDSSMIIIEDHWSPNRIIDEYHDQLKPEDIDYILEYSTRDSRGTYVDDDNHVLLRDSIENTYDDLYNTLFGIAELNGHVFTNNYVDESGNIRVFKVFWKSLKKVQKVKYYDENGDVQYKVMSEEYVPVKELGEESTSLWVNEWWEGVKIGKDIYLNMKPRSFQFNKLNNPSYCHPGIIGQIYNTNQGVAVSLMDRAKNYQYLYDAVWDRLNKAISSNYGKILELDLAKIPDGWEIDKWLYFAYVNKLAVVNSFKEGNEGSSTGKLAGAMNTVGGRSIDMSLGDYIQQHILLLEFIKTEMAEIVGISKQREGQISNRETVGGVERSVNQSSHITEYWFTLHEECKKRVLQAFLEVAKVALRGNDKKVQHILDDQTIEILNLEVEEFCDTEYGLFVTSSYKIEELEQTVKQLVVNNYLPKGGSISSVLDIFTSSSVLEMKRKVEESEDAMAQQAQAQQEEANKLAQETVAYERDYRERELNLKDIISQREEETKRYLGELKLLNEGVNEAGESLDEEKLELQRQKLRNDHIAKMRALQQDMEKHRDLMEAKKVDQSIARARKKA